MALSGDPESNRLCAVSIRKAVTNRESWPEFWLWLLGLLPILPVSAERVSWVMKDSPYRVPIELASGPYKRKDELVIVPLEAADMLKSAKPKGHWDASSLKLFEIKTDGAVEVPCDYADAKLIFRLSGETPPLTTRNYHLYFSLSKKPPGNHERRGSVPGAEEPLPGENIVPNPSFEEPVVDAAGSVIDALQLEKLRNTNLVPDANLEKGEWQLPQVAEPLKVALEKGAGRDGSAGLLIKVKGEVASPEFTVSSPHFPIKPRSRYQIRFWQWLDQQPPTGNADGVLLFLDGEKKPIANVPAYSMDKLNGEWRQLTYLGEAPEAARFGMVLVRGRQLTDTRCIFDNFEVYERVAAPGWGAIYHYADPGMEIEFVRGDAADGKQAVKISTSPLGGRCTAGTISKRFPIKPNTVYAGRCWIKLLEEGAANSFSLGAFDKDGKPAMDTWNVFMAGGGVRGRWEQVRSAGKTKPNAAWGEIVLSIGWGKGAALFDSVCLKEVPAGQPVKVTVGKMEKRK